MNINFSKEDKEIGNAIGTIIRNAPVAVAKTGVGATSVVAKLGWETAKSFFGAGKVIVNAAVDGVKEIQASMPQQQTAVTPEQLEAIKAQLAVQILEEMKAKAQAETQQEVIDVEVVGKVG